MPLLDHQTICPTTTNPMDLRTADIRTAQGQGQGGHLPPRVRGTAPSNCNSAAGTMQHHSGRDPSHSLQCSLEAPFETK